MAKKNSQLLSLLEHAKKHPGGLDGGIGVIKDEILKEMKGIAPDVDYDSIIRTVLLKVRVPEDGKTGATGQDGVNADDEAIIKEVLNKVEIPKPNEERIVNAIYKKIKTPKDGIDGVDGIDGGTGKEGKLGKTGKDGVKGKDGKKGDTGKDGEKGDDGSPDTGMEIKGKLEALKGEKRLDANAIKNLTEFIGGGATVQRSKSNVDNGTATGQILYWSKADNKWKPTTDIPDGTTATTQTALDNSTKVATTAYVDDAVSVEDLWDRDAVNGYIYPKTLNVNISKVDPEYRLTDTGDSEYARWTRTDTLGKVSHNNRAVTYGEVLASLDKTYTGTAAMGAFPDTGGIELTNGVIGGGHYSDSNYVGFTNANIEKVIDLTTAQNLSQVRFHYNITLKTTVEAPTSVVISGSNNNVDFTTIDTFNQAGNWVTTPNGAHWSDLLTVTGSYRYVKFYFTRDGNYFFPSELEVYVSGAVTEVEYLSCKDGDSGVETSIITLGVSGGPTNINGLSTRFEIAGTEQLNLTDGIFAPTTTNDIDLGSSTKLFKDIWVAGKQYFAQADGNEYISSLNDGYMDYGATTGHRFNNTLDITTTTDPQLRLTHTDGVDETDFYTNSDGELEIMPTARTIYLGDGTAGDGTFGFYGATTVYTLVHDDSEGDLKLSANDVTNFSKFEADGTLEFNGTATVWKDINMGAAQLARPASSQPDLVNFVDEAGADTGIQTYGFAVGEKIHGSFEMQHDYKEGSDFTFHVHWQGIIAPSGTDNVQWRLTYTLMRDGATLDAVTIIDSPDTTIATQYISARTDFTAITGTNYLIGDQFLFTLERVAATGDVYLGDALIATAGIHYEIDTVGSRTILIK